MVVDHLQAGIEDVVGDHQQALRGYLSKSTMYYIAWLLTCWALAICSRRGEKLVSALTFRLHSLAFPCPFRFAILLLHLFSLLSFCLFSLLPLTLPACSLCSLL